VFGFMHMALIMLGLVPLPICRGIIRDLVQVWPGMKNWMPVDEFDLLHRQLGTLCMFYIYVGAMVWIFQMSTDCFANVKNSCLAFDAAVIETFDPIENVVACSAWTVWPTWFFVFPIMYFARSGVPSPLDKLKFLRRWWFEICMYSHITVAVSHADGRARRPQGGVLPGHSRRGGSTLSTACARTSSLCAAPRSARRRSTPTSASCRSASASR
jgi:hypothetical protein